MENRDSVRPKRLQSSYSVDAVCPIDTALGEWSLYWILVKTPIPTSWYKVLWYTDYQLPTVELPCVGNVKFPLIATLNLTAINFICVTDDGEVPNSHQIMFQKLMQSSAPKHVMEMNNVSNRRTLPNWEEGSIMQWILPAKKTLCTLLTLLIQIATAIG